jgi:C-3',4' desaturase CrtD
MLNHLNHSGHSKTSNRPGRVLKVAVIGSGMSGLSAAALLARIGALVTVYERNWMTGGCSSTYTRKGYRFETGATTLVGLDDGMPLAVLLQSLGIQLNAERLHLPMQVHMDGAVINRYNDLENWIQEAELHFGPGNQAGFWEECIGIAKKVWAVSTRQLTFPPQNLSDLLGMAHNFQFGQLSLIPSVFSSIVNMLRRHNLHQHRDFIRFIDEQLLITAQNTHKGVNCAFGCTALAYTLFGNYYLYGGMSALVDKITDFIKVNGGQILLRKAVTKLIPGPKGWHLICDPGADAAQIYDAVVSAIPLNNLVELLPGRHPKTRRLSRRCFGSKHLFSALQLGIGYSPKRSPMSLHHQIHLRNPLPGLGSHSIFVSLHPETDSSRAPEGRAVASVSTHWPNPQQLRLDSVEDAINLILDELELHGIMYRDQIDYLHHSGPHSWEKWTGRKWGFVGGYPQKAEIRPWNMQGARSGFEGLYLCGDSTYPGQGIPGATLSGMIACHKLKSEYL